MKSILMSFMHRSFIMLLIGQLSFVQVGYSYEFSDLWQNHNPDPQAVTAPSFINKCEGLTGEELKKCAEEQIQKHQAKAKEDYANMARFGLGQAAAGILISLIHMANVQAGP